MDLSLLRAPPRRFWLAGALLLTPIVISLFHSPSLRGITTRGALVVCVAAAIWLLSCSARPSIERRAARLHVGGRLNLSPRCAVALVEADARAYLILYGDGFAHATPLAQPSEAVGEWDEGQRG